MENIQTLIAQYPLVEDLVALKETTWFNPGTTSLAEGLPYVGLTEHDVQDAHARLTRFAPYLAKAFPETAATGGIIESELAAIPAMQKRLEKEYGQRINGEILLKKDSHLPISGSIKARGGIYEVLTHAEKLALEAGLLSVEDDYSVLLEPRFKDFFSQYSIAVGSTGNLGMSIGIMSARIGFKVTVHMSADARAWKKAKLRSHGVTVVEYEEDYGVAVEQGRKAAESDPNCFFIDDENSRTLFLGYAVAGQRLKAQFAQQGRVFGTVDQDYLNVVLEDNVYTLPLQYNVQCIHFLCSAKGYANCFKNVAPYYGFDEIQEACKHPTIAHYEKFASMSPWHKNSVNPCTKMFDSYLKQSPWSNYEKQECKANAFQFQVEKILYRCLPHDVFVHVFKIASDRMLLNSSRQAAKLGKA